MHPPRFRLVVFQDNATIPVPHRLALVVQRDIVRLEALHVALLGLQLRARPAGHRQRRGRGRIATVAIRATDELGLPTESDLARRLVLRGFPKVKPMRV